jgi:hypothetical protein
VPIYHAYFSVFSISYQILSSGRMALGQGYYIIFSAIVNLLFIAVKDIKNTRFGYILLSIILKRIYKGPIF